MSSLYTVKQIVPSVSSVAICDDRRNLRRCPAKLKEFAYISLVRSTPVHIGMGPLPGQGHQVRKHTEEIGRQDMLKVTITRLQMFQELG